MTKCTNCERKIKRGKEAWDSCKPYCNECFIRAHRWLIERRIRIAREEAGGVFR